MDIKNITENELYEYIKSLPKEERINAIEEIYQSLENEEETDSNECFNNVIAKLEEDMILREKFYFELYYLIDKDSKLTKLGQFYKYVFTSHYIKAFKLYLTFSETLKEKNKIFKKNERANQYLYFFKYYVKDIRPSKVLKRW